MPQAKSIIHIDPRASAKLRVKIEDAIEKLVAALDAFDAPPSEDLEDGADDELTGDEEPSLSLTNDIDQARAARHCIATNEWTADLEAEHDGREPDDDREDTDEREPEDFL